MYKKCVVMHKSTGCGEEGDKCRFISYRNLYLPLFPPCFPSLQLCGAFANEIKDDRSSAVIAV